MHRPTNESDLIRDFLTSRDESAFRGLYKAYMPSLYQFVFRLVGQRHGDADDIVQDTWVRAIGGLEGFRKDSSFRTWLIGIAINRSRELFRQQSKKLDSWGSLEESKCTEPLTDEGLDLESAIASLPDGYRAVLVLHDIEGFLHEEISSILEIDVGTSKSQLSRARKTVRQKLGQAYSRGIRK